MSERTYSQSIVAALGQLQQFLPSVSDRDDVICALTGARVAALPDDEGLGHEFVAVTFPGVAPVQMMGIAYLQLKTIESVRLELDSAGHGSGAVSQRAGELLEHFRSKYDIEC